MKFFLIFHILLFIPVVFSGLVFGQSVSELIPAKTRELTIPFEVRLDRSADPIMEVELLYSQDRGVHWHLSGRKPLEAGKFGFKAETDGEYWFAFRTITLSGAMKKSSTNTPLRVLIDATLPKLALDIKQLDSGELLVVWKAEDRHLQMKRPNFAVSLPSNSSDISEKNWNPLNVDGRNIRVLDSGSEGSFRFLPESGVSQLELRATIRDFVGNQVEKTNLVTIKPVQNEKIPPVNNPVMSANTLTKKSDSTPAMHHSSTSTPLTPPQPVRMRRQTKSDRRMENKSLPKEDTEYQPKRENIQETDKNDADKNDADKNDADKNDTDKNDADKNNADKNNADKNNADKNNADKNNTDKNEADKSDTAIPVPILVSPDGKVAEIFEPIRERQPVYPNRSDKMTEELLTTMGVFFEDGLPIEVTKTIPKISAVEKSVAGQSDIPQPVVSESVIRHPMVSQTSVTQTEAKLPVAGSITGISLNTTAAQPQIIVKWNVGDAPWQESQIDILRGSTMNGPWQPIAINLRNNGEYWWFLTSLDLNPFFVMVRIRSFQSGVASDVTDTPIEINPALLKQSSSR